MPIYIVSRYIQKKEYVSRKLKQSIHIADSLPVSGVYYDSLHIADWSLPAAGSRINSNQ